MESGTRVSDRSREVEAMKRRFEARETDGPAVSVVMPVYNHAEFCVRAVESILAQTFRDFEVIVVDDGSTDGSLGRLAAVAEADQRVRVLGIPHSGIVPALNRGIDLARGRYIARMDADDESLPERLEAQLEVLTRNPRIGAVDCQVELMESEVTGGGMREYVGWLNSVGIKGLIGNNSLFIESPLVHPAVLMTREALRAAGGYQDVSGPEDYSLWLRMAAAGFELAKAPRYLFRWRDLPGRLTRNSRRYSENEIMAMKAEFLPRLVPRVALGVQVWGAGRTGRKAMRHLREQGVRILRIFDIDPKKIGRVLHGSPILALDELPAFREELTLVALGSREAKREVERWMKAHGFEEDADYLYIS